MLALHRAGKNVRLDLNLVSTNGDLINIEVQVAREPGLTNRMQYYLSKNYVNQLLGGEGFEKARRAISVWVCAFRFRNDGV